MTTNEIQTNDATSVASTPAGDGIEHTAAIQQLLEGQSAWDKRLIACSDWMNPILVKETRQALKSRQFSWTLVLLTIVVLAW